MDFDLAAAIQNGPVPNPRGDYLELLMMISILHCLHVDATDAQIMEFVNNKQFMNLLYGLNKRIGPVQPTRYGEHDSSKLTSNYIGLLARIILICKYKAGQAYESAMRECKSILIGRWEEREGFLEYFRFSEIDENASVILESLSSAYEVFTILIEKYGWLFKKVLNKAMKARQDEDQFDIDIFDGMHDLVMRCTDHSLIQKLINLDFVQYLNWILSVDVTISDMVDIIEMMNCFVKIDKSVMDKVPNLKIQLDDLRKNYDDVDLPRSIKEFECNWIK